MRWSYRGGTRSTGASARPLVLGGALWVRCGVLRLSAARCRAGAGELELGGGEAWLRLARRSHGAARGEGGLGTATHREAARQETEGRGQGHADVRIPAFQSAPRTALPRSRQTGAPNRKRKTLRCSQEPDKHTTTKSTQRGVTLQTKFFRKLRMQKVLDEMFMALHCSNKFPKNRHGLWWSGESVHGV